MLRRKCENIPQRKRHVQGEQHTYLRDLLGPKRAVALCVVVTLLGNPLHGFF